MISERRETNKLLEYLRIKTVQPEPDYGIYYFRKLIVSYITLPNT